MVKNVLNTLRKKQKNNKGFSLVELIIVIAIMAVLVAVIAPQLIKYVEKGRESTDISSVDNIGSALQTYYSDRTIPTGGVTVEIKAGVAITETAVKDAHIEKTTLKGDWGTDGITITLGTDGQLTITGEATYYKYENNEPKAK